MPGLWQRMQHSQHEAVQRNYLRGLWDTRARRRRVVGVGALALALQWSGLLVIWLTAPSDLARDVYITIAFVSLVIYVPAVSLLNMATRGSVGVAERFLDERQTNERLRAFAGAHRVTTVILTALAVLAFALSFGEEDTMTIPTAIVFPVIYTIVVTHFVAPLLVAGWRLPDPPPDDEEDEEDE